MAEWLDSLHKNQEQIRVISYDLSELAIAFARTGNDFVYTELKSYVLKLRKVADSIHKTSGLIVSENLKNAENSSANMLKMALVVSESLSEKKDT